MRFGVREICDVVLKAKTAQKIGNRIFYANEPVIYFDTLKTSSMEGAATTVYAQGGKGNSRLVAWEGERTVTFTMEDALISPEGFMILSGAGLIDATASKPIYQHVTETVDATLGVQVAGSGDNREVQIKLQNKPYLPENANGNFAYVMFKKNDEIITEPYIPKHEEVSQDADGNWIIRVTNSHVTYDLVDDTLEGNGENVRRNSPIYTINDDDVTTAIFNNGDNTLIFDSVLVDYYVERESNAQQIEITADKFGGNFYLEASTLFRDQRGVDMPAEFIIPNCKIQSNFTFTMASSGDPSTFTFTMDAFPDYTRFDHSKKVLAAIQIIRNADSLDLVRGQTAHQVDHEDLLKY